MKTKEEKRKIAQDRQDARLAAEPDAKVKVKFTEQKPIDDFSTDALKYFLQNAQPTESEAYSKAISGEQMLKARRYNGAHNQGGTNQDPNTQPLTSPTTFNLSGYPEYTPSQWLVAFLKTWNDWAAANLHQGGKKRK
jgi:hypothetical protein